MSLMDILDDYIYGPLNLIDRLEGLIKAAHYQDTGVRFAILRANKGGKHTLHQISKILERYGIPLYCRTHDANHMYFRVKKRQAAWAEYLLLHAGVELNNPPIDPRNDRSTANHPPGWMPPAWIDRATPSSEQDTQSTQPAKPQAGFWQKLDQSLNDFLDR